MDTNKIYKLIQSALDRGTDQFSAEDIIKGINEKQLDLWLGEESLMVSQVAYFPRKKSLHILLGAGKLEELLEMLTNEVEPAARLDGCKDITIVGRKGWKKIFEPKGWTQDYVYLNRRL